MFTGLVEEKGRVRALESPVQGAAVITIEAEAVLGDVHLGDSIAVNGVCLTVTNIANDTFDADMMAETLARTAVGDLRPGDDVNLERAVRAETRLGGHIVQGHIDGVGQCTKIEAAERWTTLTFALPADLAGFVAEKGSIAIDGVSLTVSAVSDPSAALAANTVVAPNDLGSDWVQVSLIPTTLAETTLGAIEVGDRVNLEVDVIAKYVDRLLTVGRP